MTIRPRELTDAKGLCLVCGCSVEAQIPGSLCGSDDCRELVEQLYEWDRDAYCTGPGREYCTPGWGLFDVGPYLEIEKDDDMDRFVTDDVAVAHVCAIYPWWVDWQARTKNKEGK